MSDWKFRVLLTDYAWPDVEVERRVLAEIGAELIVAAPQRVEDLAAAAAGVDAILTCWAPVRAEVIAAAARCRVISRMGIGLDNIDLAEAKRRGIAVTNVPDYCTAEVAEHTLAVIFALGRQVAFHHRRTKAGEYDAKGGATPRRMSGQTLGIVGLGNIGSEVARRALAVGLRVIATSRTQRDLPHGADWRSLHELLAQSDYVSLHLPFTEESRRMIAAEQLARMKPTAFLINTARGGLIDHDALAAALAQDLLAGAALDVQDPEPPNLFLPPFNDPRVIVTPHMAFISDESLLELRTRATRNVADFLLGRTVKDLVTG